LQEKETFGKGKKGKSEDAKKTSKRGGERFETPGKIGKEKKNGGGKKKGERT